MGACGCLGVPRVEREGELRDQLSLGCGVVQPLTASCIFTHLTLND